MVLFSASYVSSFLSIEKGGNLCDQCGYVFRKASLVAEKKTLVARVIKLALNWLSILVDT